MAFAAVLLVSACGPSPVSPADAGTDADATRPPLSCSGVVCDTTRANTSASCVDSACSYSCNPGFGDCDGNAANGCEADLNDPAHCGTCSNTCPTPQDGHATCNAGACGITCEPGFMVSGRTCTCASPRPIAPLAGSVVQPKRVGETRTVLFRVDAPETLRAQIEFCEDRACTTPYATVTTVNMDGTRTLPTAAASRTVIYWRTVGAYSNGGRCTSTPSNVSEFFLGAPTVMGATGPGGVWGNSPDLNSDGRADVIVGDPANNKVFFYVSVPAEMTTDRTSAARILTAPSDSPAGFGTKVSAAGDVNGDGVTDLLVTSSFGTGARLYVFHGPIAAGAGSVAPARTLPGDFLNAAALGDVNGDGYGDLATLVSGNIQLYLGSASGTSDTPRVLPNANITNAMGVTTSVATVGDVNGDGLSDFAVGVTNAVATTAGRAYLYLGRAEGPSLLPRILAPTAGAQPESVGSFGTAVAGAGDFSGDGFVDFAVGRPVANSVDVFRGAADIGSSSTTIASNALSGGARAGFRLASGDFNRDGRGDLLLANQASNSIRYVLGSATPVVVEISSPATDLSYAVGVHDLNGDGFSDALAGSQNEGVVRIFLGRADGNFNVANPAPFRFLQPRLVDAPMGSTFGRSIALLQRRPHRTFF